MNLLPVPCPICGGLVNRLSVTPDATLKNGKASGVKCIKCGAQWITARELLFDGLCIFSDRASRIAACQEWNTIPAVVQGMQDVADALAIRHKYDIELERTEPR